MLKKGYRGMRRVGAWWLEWIQGAGGFGLACSLIGIQITIILLFLSPFTMASDPAAVPRNVATISVLLLPFGLAMDSTGLIGGILGVAKEEKKGPGIAGIVLGVVDIAILVGMVSLFQGLWIYYNVIGNSSLGGP